ncbi:thrombospondin type-1 domain-containing protein 7a [Plakobranchus ocellatus]|uniref:Thrombospondin type-1 domain-containing protein 7a n=1 Tax=Plakobranchus ocellatus TaxID=259542 RepID=A0AAV4BJ21_9GAST|nr:thrombospondin type-1 domain-containing protein 7a [Plakobranchus ocellatus]
MKTYPHSLQLFSCPPLAGPWTECNHRSCGPGGIQYRNVTCVLWSGQTVLKENCALETKPSEWRSCTKPCGQRVILGQPEEYPGESPDERYPSGYDSVRESLDQGYTAPDWGSRQSGAGRDFPTYRDGSGVEWVVSPFGSCKLKPGAECGLKNGVQYSNVTCQMIGTQVLVSEARCLQGETRPPSSRPCDYLCKQDCIVSNFTVTTTCEDACQTPNRTWTRRVIVPPRHKGDHCPRLSVMEPCPKCANSFTYQLSEWSPCTNLRGSYLNGVKSHHLIGHQTREISCLQSKGVKASLRFCSDALPETLLVKDRACVMPQDCKVSDWSSISHHNTSCMRQDGTINYGYKIRTRQVLQLPLGEGRPCPSVLTDYIEDTNKDLSLLRPYEIQSERPVDSSRCSQPRPVEAKSCNMECNWDCSVSQWSAWSSCQAGPCTEVNLRRRRQTGGSDGLGQRYRTRRVLTLPGPNGQSCPHLNESRMCKPEPCFRWNITKEQCQPHRGTCGEGSLTQSAKCINRDGMEDRDRYCNFNLHAVENWAKCYVPCPEDCVLGEWSAWSVCPDPCLVQPGVRSSRSRQRVVLAYHDSGRNGRPCPSPSSLRQSESCPVLLDCATYRWVVGNWQSCKLNSDPVRSGLPVVIPVQEIGRRCGDGVQTRSVECITDRGDKADPSKCVDSIRPVSSRPCNVTCSVDCHVSEWSEWSPCSVTCVPVQALQSYPEKERQRYILREPENGGQNCPSELFQRQACLELPVCQVHFWETSDWSDCILPPVVPLCGHGLRARNISCKHADSRGTREVAVSECLERLGTMPDVTEPCHSPCESECQLSAWSQWTQCWPGSCDKTRFRYRRLQGLSKTNPKCRNTERYPRDQHETCPCTEYESRNCSIPCPVDCNLTAWSEWSPCSVHCGAGIRYRNRTVITQPANGGRMCPFMDDGRTETQTKVCTEDCNYHKWKADQWGQCMPHAGRSCGEGEHTRSIRCVSIGPQGAERIVQGSFCDSRDRPPEVKSCSLPCPSECVLSEWSDWTQCREPCDGNQLQSRTRTVLRYPASYARSRRCTDEREDRPCLQNCAVYKWELSDWTSCLVNGGRAECGAGHKEKYVICRNQRGEKVDRHLCDEHAQPVTEPLAVSCESPCDNDCLMSSWSAWSHCSTSCGLGLTQRRRTVLQKPVGNGRKCPEKVEQVKPCFRKGCFTWVVSDWSPCTAQKGVCGATGVQERNVSCVNDEGRPVNSSKCSVDPEKLVMQTIRSCNVPCPGECKLSEWSVWTKCYISCEDFRHGLRVGVKVRSRAILAYPSPGNPPCDTKLWEEATCYAQYCSWFDWAAPEWNYATKFRRVVCIRNDGLEVTGQRACGKARTGDKRVPANSRVDFLPTAPLKSFEERQRRLL